VVLLKVLHGPHTIHGTVVPTSAAVLAQPPTIPIAAAATIVQSYLRYTATAAYCSQATTTAYTCQLPMLQLWENRPFHEGLLPAQAGKLTASSSTFGEPAQGPSTLVWPHQLHHHGGDTHGRGSTCGCVLPQRMSYYHTI
jgi:hypothetical protein